MVNPNDAGRDFAYAESLGALTFALDKVTGAIQDSIDVLGESQKVSNALGRSFSLSTGQLPQAISKLDGTISQKLSVAFEALSLGLNVNSSEVLKLAEFQKITGQDYKASLKLFQSLQKTLDLSIDESDKLAVSLQDTSTKYGVSTEYLVNALQTFTDQNKDVLSVLGTTGPIADAVQQIQGAFGPGLQKDINTVLSLLFSKGTEQQATIANLGLTSVRKQLATVGSSEEALALLNEAIKTAGLAQQRYAAAASGDIGAVTDALNSLTGAAGYAAGRLIEKFDDIAEVNTGKVFTDITQSILKIFDPIKESFLNFVTSNREIIQKLIDGATSFVEDILKVFGPAEIIFGSVVAAITSFIITIKSIISFIGTIAIAPFLEIVGIVSAVVLVLAGFGKAIYDNLEAFTPFFNTLKQIGLFLFNIIKVIGFLIFKLGEFAGEILGFIFSLVSPIFEAIERLFEKINSLFPFGDDSEEKTRKKEDSNNLSKAANALEGLDSRDRERTSSEKAVSNLQTLSELRAGAASSFKRLEEFNQLYSRLQEFEVQKTIRTEGRASLFSAGNLEGEVKTLNIKGASIEISDISPEVARKLSGLSDEQFNTTMQEVVRENQVFTAEAINRAVESNGGRSD